MILSWGKPTIKTTTSTSGTPGSSWTTIDTPKEDTTTLTTEEGEEKTATEEGGEVVDVVYEKNTYTLSFQLFMKKGESLPWADNDGVIAGEHAIQVIPEDPTCIGIQIDRCAIRAVMDYSSSDGILVTYNCKVLKPATGNMVKTNVISAGE